MKFRKWINSLSLALGIILGPYALISAKASQPPLEWNFMPFMFFGSVISILWIVGIQLIRKDPKHSRWALRMFLPISIFMAGSGIGALATDIFYGEFGPASVLLLILGIGLLVGVYLSRLIFNAKFSTTL